MAKKKNKIDLRNVIDTATKEAVEKKIKPAVKKVFKKHIKDEIIDKDFVDNKGRYRAYMIRLGTKNERPNNAPAFMKPVELGKGRTQSAKYNKMANDEYIITTEFKDDKFLMYNTMPPPGKSIFGTPIENINDELLYTKWIVNGDIFMPPYIMDKRYDDTTERLYWIEELRDKNKTPAERWAKYKESKSDNRYEARPFVDNTANEIRDRQFQEKMQDYVIEELRAELIKALNKK